MIGLGLSDMADLRAGNVIARSLAFLRQPDDFATSIRSFSRHTKQPFMLQLFPC
jgi:hypothetical protein